MSKVKNISKFLTALGAKSVAKYMSNDLEYIINKTSLNPHDADNANPENEDEYMRTRSDAYKKGIPFPDKKPNTNPLYRDIGSWDDEDLQAVMKSREYQYDSAIQKKVQKYFEKKYPGSQRLDATGRPY